MSIAQDPAKTADGCDSDIGRMTVNMLPDDVLLIIFAFYVGGTRRTNGWATLGHVCRKWRNNVFGSPRHLNLQLVHTERTRIRKTLDVWPPLPIAIKGNYYSKPGQDDLMATLEHNDRVCEIELWFDSNSLWQRVLATMQVPFPMLTDLGFRSHWHGTLASDIPDSFLGGSAPRLRTFFLYGIPFPGLLKLLSTAADLVGVQLEKIPPSGYFAPETLITCLSALTSLESLHIGFKYPGPRPVRESQPPLLPTCTLPSLTYLYFQGVSEYLEEVVARIDAPLLNGSVIIFFDQLIFDTPQLTQFISRTPLLKAYDKARVTFSYVDASVVLAQTNVTNHSSYGRLQLSILCEPAELPLASLVQVCSSSIPQAFLLTVERLDILKRWSLEPHPPDNIESGQWLELLRPFIAVEALYLSAKIAAIFTPALQELAGERATEVLPVLQSLFLEKPDESDHMQKAIGQFTAARELSGHPVSVSRRSMDDRF